MLKVLIVEDERHAREKLETQLLQVRPESVVLARLDSVKGAVSWLRLNTPDLIFLDIHLADDLSFKIFEQVDVKAPIIFTTAYDQHALEAFRQNSIDYLLKPISEEDLRQSLLNYERMKESLAPQGYHQLLQLFEGQKEKTYHKRFLITRSDKLLTVPTEEVAYFEGEDRYVYLVKRDGTRYIIDYKLADLEQMLDPQSFFRLNRSFITHIDALDRNIVLSKSRIKVYLKPQAKRDVIVSAANARSFKEWLNGGK